MQVRATLSLKAQRPQRQSPSWTLRTGLIWATRELYPPEQNSCGRPGKDPDRPLPETPGISLRYHTAGETLLENSEPSVATDSFLALRGILCTWGWTQVYLKIHSSPWPNN